MYAAVENDTMGAGAGPSHQNMGSAASTGTLIARYCDNRLTCVLAGGHAKSLGAVQDVDPNLPPPKTDKPRPHICAICTRGFARLEHLKRHERSHTKEKPFACNECTRCFARRDLLLRHQQKLHLSVPPSTRRRRESASSSTGNGSTRVRKNSVASNSSGVTNASMRPRANTISHVDNSALGAFGHISSPPNRSDFGLGLDRSGMNGLPGVGNHHYRGMSSINGHHGHAHVLPRLETKGRYLDMGTSLRTAPPHGSCGSDNGVNGMLFGGATINPAQLHFTNSPQAFGFDSPTSPFQQGFPSFAYPHGPTDGEAWLSSFDQQMSFADEQAIDNSSPSVVDSASPTAMSEMMIDDPNTSSSADWSQSFHSQAPFGSYHNFPDFHSLGALSPKSSSSRIGATDPFFAVPPPLPSNAPLPTQPFFSPDFSLKSDTPSNSTASVSSSNRQSSVTSVSTDSITDATRQALISSLSEKSGKRQSLRKANQPNPSLPIPRSTVDGKNLPSTLDLQRYVAAYLKYFHPHLPFLHAATLSFDTPAFTNDLSSCENASSSNRVMGGGGCLVLAIASIGALYEYDFTVSKHLAEMAKTMIQLYLQEHRKAETASSVGTNSAGTEMNSHNTPLWLVQAMLLNVIYGHNSGDKTSAGIANTHCAALISLARGADLVKPTSSGNHPGATTLSKQKDSSLSDDDPSGWSGYISHPALELKKEWHSWKHAEERKRTLYAIFILSSLLVSAYNSSPALMNSEILLNLPCDERLWCAESPDAWRSLGGSFTQQHELSFASALSSLLSASHHNQPRQRRMSKPFDSAGAHLESLPEDDLRPSTFGCLILINALHNYIWETRQHHMGRDWSQQDTDRLHAHIEPALRAWQAAWSSNPNHSLERPNPFGATSLSADCIPLLDLAYVRLFVNLGRSKELFFQRDWDAMAEEFANGSETVLHAEHSPQESPVMNELSPASISGSDQGFIDLEGDVSASAPNGCAAQGQCSVKCSKRESHLRKAAFCAANSLMMSDRLNVTFADFNSKELPLQSALCAFDCAQILAEWVSTIQQRVGRYVGILGRDVIDLSQAPASMFLEDDDCKLLEKIKEILANAEAKMNTSINIDPMDTIIPTETSDLESSGYGSKILSVHARMFEREAVWPGECQFH